MILQNAHAHVYMDTVYTQNLRNTIERANQVDLWMPYKQVSAKES